MRNRERSVGAGCGASALDLGRRPLSCDFRISFSVLRYSITACCCRFNQPAKIAIRKYIGNWAALISFVCSRILLPSIQAQIQFLDYTGKPIAESVGFIAPQ